MASRVNKKFVTILVGVLVVLFGGAVVAVKVSTRKSGDDHVAKGDSAFAAGEWDDAVRFYSMAVNKDQRNAEWIKKWIGAMEKTTPTLRQTYSDNYSSQYIGALRALADADRNSVASCRRILDETYNRFRLGGTNTAAWDSLTSLSNEILKNYRGDEQAGKELLRFRALAALNAVSTRADAVPSDFDPIRKDFEAAVSVNPGDEECVVGLSMTDSAAADALRRQNDAVGAQAMLDAARARLTAFRDRHPPAASASLTALRIDLSTAARESREGAISLLKDRRVALSGVVDAVIASKPESLDRGTIVATATYALYGLENGSERVNEVFEHVLKGYPNDASLMISWARMLMQRGEIDAAVEKLEKVAALPDRPLSLEGMMLFSYRPEAVRFLADSMFSAWESSTESSERVQYARRAREYREQLKALVGEQDISLVAIDSRLAYIQGDINGARTLLTRYNEQTGERDELSMLLMAQILSQQGNSGAAKRAFERVFELNSQSPQAILALSQIEFQAQNYPRAVAFLTSAAAMFPERKGLGEQLALAKQLQEGGKSTDPIVKVMLQVQELTSGINADRKAAAKVLRDALAVNANDPRLSSMLAQTLAADQDREGAKIVVREALARHPDHGGLKSLDRALSITDPVQANLEAIDQANASEVQKALARHDVYVGAGQRDKAREQIAKAAALEPENPLVVEYQFQHAILDTNKDEIDRLTALATAKNLDQADGLVFRARAETSRREVNAAMATLKEVVRKDRLNQMAWRLLGGLYLMQGQYPLAADAINTAIQIRPTDVLAVTMYIRALQGSGQADRALAFARENERLAAGDPDYRNLLLVLESTAPAGDRAKAIAARERIAGTDPQNVENKHALTYLLIETKKFDKAKPIIDELRNSSNEAVYLESVWHASQDRPDEAMRIYRAYADGLPEDKRNEQLYMAGAKLAQQLRRSTETIKFLEEGRKYQDPKFLRIDRELGDTYYGLGQFDEAYKTYQKIVAAGADSEGLVLISSAEALLRLQKFKELDELLASLGAKAQTDATLLLLGAESARGQGDRERARRMLDQAVVADPKNAITYFRRAEFSFKDPAMDRDVEADLDQALKLAPWLTAARIELASRNLSAGRTEAALELMRDGLKQSPRDDSLRNALITQLMSMDRQPEALDLVEAAVKLDADRPDWRLRGSQIMAQTGRWKRSAELLKPLWDKDPSRDNALLYVGSLINIQPPDLQTALQVLATKELKTADDPGLRLTRARIHVIGNKAAEAYADVVGAYEKTDCAGPTSAQVFSIGLGGVYSKQEDRIIALDRLEKTKSLDRWCLLHASIIRLRTPERAAAAEQDLVRLAETVEDSNLKLACYQVLGTTANFAKRFPEAVEYYKKGLAVDPDHAELNNNLAYTMGVELGRTAEAVPFALKAAARLPNNPTILDTLGALHVELKEWDKAIPVLERAINLGTNEGDLVPSHLHLGRARLFTNDVGAARLHANRCEELLARRPDLRDIYGKRLKDLQEAIDAR